jgi:hypothetical protein
VPPVCEKFVTKNFFRLKFLDKKIFTVKASLNRRNNKWLSHDPNDVPVGSRIRFIASVCVLGYLSYMNVTSCTLFFSKRVKRSPQKVTLTFFF